jgi:glycerol uptake facilitator-like aquaporin
VKRSLLRTRLANSLATGAMLFVLINIFSPLSGADYNPIVTLTIAATQRLSKAEVPFYIFAQLAGGIAGVVLAHLMFDLPLLQTSEKIRWGMGQWVAEAIATFSLLEPDVKENGSLLDVTHFQSKSP